MERKLNEKQLGSLTRGSSAQVVRVASTSADRLSLLASYGVVPGNSIRLRQRFPAMVIEIGDTTLALESDVARDIWVASL